MSAFEVLRRCRVIGLTLLTSVALGACSGEAPPAPDSVDAGNAPPVFSVAGDLLELCKHYGSGDMDEDRVRDLGCELLVSVGFDNARINTGLDPEGLCLPINNSGVQRAEIDSIETATRFALTWIRAEPARAEALTVELLQLVFLKNNPFCPHDLTGATAKPVTSLMANVTVTAQDFMAYCGRYGQTSTNSEKIRDHACQLYVVGTADYLSKNASDVPGGFCLDDDRDAEYLMSGVFDYMLANQARVKHVDGFAAVMTAVRTQSPCDVVATQSR